MSSQLVNVVTEDEFILTATRFDPRTVRAAVVIGCATGIQAKFYRDFAVWLASQDVGVVTFDYRYAGLSFPPPYNPATFTPEERHAAVLTCPQDIDLTNTWGRKDMGAVIRFASTTWPDVPLTMVGHSLGAHLMSLIPEECPRITRFLNVCGGNAYYRHLTDPVNSLREFTERVIKPFETDRVLRVSAIGLGFDLPYGPGTEWIKWYLHPHFSLRNPFDASTTQRLTIPYLSVGFSDDNTVSKAAMYQHVSLFPHPSKSQPIHSLWVDPKKNHNWPPIGHVGSFQKFSPDTCSSKADTIWAVYLQWIVDGTVDESVGEYRRWTSADSRDLRKEREEFERESNCGAKL